MLIGDFGHVLDILCTAEKDDVDESIFPKMSLPKPYSREKGLPLLQRRH